METIELTQYALTPLADHTLVLPLNEASDWTMRAQNAGIELPETLDKGRPEFGVVLAIGPEVTDWKVEDRILFSRWGGVDVDLGEEHQWLIRKQDVLARLEPR